MPTCNRCGQEITWAEPYQKGMRPLNSDGSSVHECPQNTPSTPPAATGTPQQTTIQEPKPVSNATERLDNCRLMLQTGIELCKKLAGDIIPTSESTEEFHDNTQRVIVFEVMLKSFCYNWVRF